VSAPIRFLGLVVLAWAGVRAATVGALPGAEVFRIGPSEARTAAPPIAATEFPPLDPLPMTAEGEPLPPDYLAPPTYPAAQRGPNRTSWAPAPDAAAASLSRRPTSFAGVLPTPAAAYYSPVPPLDQWPLAQIARGSLPVRSSSVAAPRQSVPPSMAPQRAPLDRVQLTAWALLRGGRGMVSSPTAIASGGTLGGSQAGARLNVALNRHIAASIRTTSDVGRRGAEVAAGVRLQPVLGVPVWITAERRQRLGKTGGGRNAFALFLESGVYGRPLPGRFTLDAYAQAGVVGFRRRDKFVDGAVTVTRPVYKNLSAGLGLWGGAQPGLYRVDAGPRLSLKVRDNVRVHLDYRHRLAGNAEPGSGPTLTLAGDF
jgi:hypothetical protein